MLIELFSWFIWLVLVVDFSILICTITGQLAQRKQIFCCSFLTDFFFSLIFGHIIIKLLLSYEAVLFRHILSSVDF